MEQQPRYDNTTTAEPQYIKNAAETFSLFPMVGIFVSAFTTALMLLKDRPWSWMLLLYTLVPLIGFSIFSIIGHLALRNKSTVRLLFLKGKWKYVTIFSATVLIVLEIILFHSA